MRIWKENRKRSDRAGSKIISQDTISIQIFKSLEKSGQFKILFAKKPKNV